MPAALRCGEDERCKRFAFDDDRRDYAVAHALLRRLLSHRHAVSPEAWRFEATPSGKPRVAADFAALPLAFSLSHARGLVACAVSEDAEVGIEVDPPIRSPTTNLRFPSAQIDPTWSMVGLRRSRLECVPVKATVTRQLVATKADQFIQSVLRAGRPRELSCRCSGYTFRWPQATAQCPESRGSR
jgi:hypothetical protein